MPLRRHLPPCIKKQKAAYLTAPIIVERAALARTPPDNVGHNTSVLGPCACPASVGQAALAAHLAGNKGIRHRHHVQGKHRAQA